MPTSLASGDNIVTLDPPDTGIAWLDIALLSLVAIVTTAAICIAVFSRIASKPIKEMKSLLFQVKEDAAVTREQTENSHKTAAAPNLRDNIDINHGEILSALTSIQIEISEQRKDIGGLRSENRNDREQMGQIAARLDQHIAEKSDFMPRLIALEHQNEINRNKKTGR